MADQEREEFDPLAEEPAPIPSHGMTVRDPGTAKALDEILGQDADPDEEPPDPEGHALPKAVADFLGTKEYFHGPLPHDIAAIWGHPPIRYQDEATCRVLISAWGMEAFRGSALHTSAVQAAAREAVTAPSRAEFKREREKKKGQR